MTDFPHFVPYIPLRVKRYRWKPDIDTHEEVIGTVFDSEYRLMNRMRLACEVFSADGKGVERCPSKGTSFHRDWGTRFWEFGVRLWNFDVGVWD